MLLFNPTNKVLHEHEPLGERLRKIDTREKQLITEIEYSLLQFAQTCTDEKEKQINKLSMQLQASIPIQTKNKSIFSEIKNNLPNANTLSPQKYAERCQFYENYFEERKQKFLHEQQIVLNKEMEQNDLKRKKIKDELRPLMDSDQNMRIKAFKIKLERDMQDINCKLQASLVTITKDVSQSFREYKNVDLMLYKTINDLAKEYLHCLRNELKLSVAVCLSPFTNYNMQMAIERAEEVVLDLSIQLNKKNSNKISFELIAKNTEEALKLKPEDNNFETILLKIKAECFDFTARAEYLFTSLFDAKKREYKNSRKVCAMDVLIEQERTCSALQKKILDYMLNRVDINEFNQILVDLATQEVNLKSDPLHSQEDVDNFERHRIQALQQRSDLFNSYYDNYFIINNISDNIKNLLNRSEVQKYFYQRITGHYMQHNESKVYYLGSKKLSAKDALNELMSDLELYEALTTNSLTEHINNNHLQHQN